MLDKDQYNQDEYNDYYRQEASGAEISANRVQKNDGVKGKLLILLLLLLLGVAGYFSYKSFGDASKNNIVEEELVVMGEKASLPSSIQEEDSPKGDVTKTTVKKMVQNESNTLENINMSEGLSTTTSQLTNVENTITQEVAKTATNTGDMTPEQIAQVVQMVMMQMNEKKKASAQMLDTPQITTKDTDLMDELAQISVESIEETMEQEVQPAHSKEDNLASTTELMAALMADLDSQGNGQGDKSNKVDTYNKVTVQDTTGFDSLSALSDQISSIVNEGVKVNTAQTYTSNLEKEVVVRQNEMRIIVVKKGDTLGKIAKRAYGNVMDFQKIYDANPDMIRRADRIYIGQKLRIPNQ